MSSINRFVFLNGENGANVEYEGPFEYVQDGGSFEVIIPVASSDGVGVHETTAKKLSDRIGSIGIALADGGVEASGVIEAADIIDGKLIVRVNNPSRITPSQADFNLSGADVGSSREDQTDD